MATFSCEDIELALKWLLDHWKTRSKETKPILVTTGFTAYRFHDLIAKTLNAEYVVLNLILSSYLESIESQ